VLLGADPLFADVSVFAPAAAGHLDFFTNSPTDGAGFQQIGYDVPRVATPGFHDFAFFPDFFEFVVA